VTGIAARFDRRFSSYRHGFSLDERRRCVEIQHIVYPLGGRKR